MTENKNKMPLRVIDGGGKQEQLKNELEDCFVRFITASGSERQALYDRMMEIDSRLAPGAELRVVD